MNKQSLLQSRTIDWLRFPMAVMVVVLHSAGQIPQQIDWCRFDGNQFNYLIRIAGSNVFSHIAVPLFFLISGYLFFSGIQEDLTSYFKKIKKRFYSLFIPYVLWICIALLFHFCRDSLYILLHSSSWEPMCEWMRKFFSLSSFWDVYIWNSDRINWLGMTVTSSSPYNIPLWFIRDLMVMVLLSPILGKLLQVLRGVPLLIILSICYITLIWPSFPGFDIESIFYYSLGAWIAIYNKNILVLFKPYMKPCICISLVLGLILVVLNGHHSFWGNKIYPFFIITGVVSVFSLASIIVQTKGDSPFNLTVFKLKDKSFFLFASHSLILPYVMKVLDSFMPNHYLFCVTNYLATPVITIILSLSLYFIMNRFTPSSLNVLIGGR